jgi:hypothetical protein
MGQVAEESKDVHGGEGDWEVDGRCGTGGTEVGLVERGRWSVGESKLVGIPVVRPLYVGIWGTLKGSEGVLVE